MWHIHPIKLYCVDLDDLAAGYLQLHVHDKEDTTLSESTRCGSWWGSFPTDQTGSIACDGNPTGRYITLYRDENDSPNEFLALCEVVVMGADVIGKYHFYIHVYSSFTKFYLYHV